MPDVKRMDPNEAWERLHGGGESLLVCAYDDAEKCRQNALPGSIDWQTFSNRLTTLPKDREIILYCA